MTDRYKHVLFFFLIISSYSCENSQVSQKTDEKTTIEIVEKEHDFGTLKMTDSVNHRFKIRNTGDHPLILKDAKASCGCTTSSFTQTPISKNELGEVLVSFKPSAPGKFRKSVVVELNSDSAFTVFYIKGEVSSR